MSKLKLALHFSLLTFLFFLSSCAGSRVKKATISQATLMQWEDSITNIIRSMTLDEKVAMLHGKNMFSSAGIPRLGIADLEYADGPFGIREEMVPHGWNSAGLTTDSATFFPTGSALAATWSIDDAYNYGKGMAKEARLRGKDMILGPAINIQRIPTGGRSYEYFSEDPLLAARLAVAYTKGVQENKVAVCLKHYAVNNQELFRGTVDARISQRALHEVYLLPFQQAVEEAGAFGVMAAYNKVNGRWCSENDELENHILRKQWAFRGIVISDWGGTHSTVDAVKAGLNVEMPGQRFLGDALLDSLRSGAVSEKVVDERVRELLRVRFAIPPIPAEKANQQTTSQPEQQRIAYEVAKRSIVLLKNTDHALPIDLTKNRRIAVIGALADARQAQGGVGAGVKALYEITPLEGLKRAIGNDTEITYVPGYPYYQAQQRFQRVSPWHEADARLIAEAVEAARNADLVIFFAGTGREVETEGSDRQSILLPMGQDEVAAAVAAVNPNMLTVIVSGGAVDLRSIQPLSKALLMSWFNGSEGGNALADVLIGKVSPSGKLPFTLPMRLEDNPAYSLGVYPQQAQQNGDVFVDLVNKKKGEQSAQGPVASYEEDIFVGYRWYESKNISVMYPFGHGLSYASFEYSKLSTSVNRQGDIELQFTLKNTGNCDAEEVVQAYVSRIHSAVQRPQKELKGFTRIQLKAGASQNVKMLIPRAHLCHWNEKTDGWDYEQGEATLLIGSSSADIKLETPIKL